MISPYQMMRQQPVQPEQMGPLMGRPPMQPQMPMQPPMQPPMMQQTPPDFTQTAAGPEPAKQIREQKDMLGDQISQLTFEQAKLKRSKDILMNQQSAYEDILNRIKGVV
jgi:hypothetical protein